MFLSDIATGVESIMATGIRELAKLTEADL